MSRHVFDHAVRASLPVNGPEGNAPAAVTLADGLKALNQTPVGPDMGLTALGRVYFNVEPEQFAGSTVFYASKIHVAPVGEYGHGKSLKHIAETAQKIPCGLYMGAAGFMNFAYIAAARPKDVILFDVNPLQTLFWEKTIALIRETPDLNEFLYQMQVSGRRMRDEIEALLGPVYYRGRGLYHRQTDFSDAQPFRETEPEHFFRIYEGMPEDEQWWKTQDAYSHIHTLAKAGRIGAVTLDLFHEPSFVQLRAFLGERRVSMMYISNIMRHPNWTGRYDYEYIPLRERGWKNIGMITYGLESRFINDNGLMGLEKRDFIYAPQLGIGKIAP